MDEPPPNDSGKDHKTSRADERLQAEIKLSLQLPRPESDPYWILTQRALVKEQKGFLGIFKKKDITEEQLVSLRKQVENSPGQGKIKIQNYLKKFPDNNTLKILDALCAHRMIMNSADRKNVVETLKTSTKDAAEVLINNGISLFNIETFFQIYFEYLYRIKRFQVTTYNTVKAGVSYKSAIKGLAISIKVCDVLLGEKNRCVTVLNQIRGRFKSSEYIAPWDLQDIKKAARLVESKKITAISGPAKAGDLLLYSLAFTDLFARIPIMNPLVKTILKLIPEYDPALVLKKKSIVTVQLFKKLNLAIQEENIDQKRKLGRLIFKETSRDIEMIASQPITSNHQAEPYFSMSRVTLQTFGSYNAEQQQEMLQASMNAMKQVIKLDQSKNHVYKHATQKVLKKLALFMTNEP